MGGQERGVLVVGVFCMLIIILFGKRVLGFINCSLYIFCKYCLKESKKTLYPNPSKIFRINVYLLMVTSNQVNP